MASAMLLLAALPVMVSVALAIALVDGRPVFHFGGRLGRRQRTFSMLKFRTLVPNAEAILGASLESPVFRVRTGLGGFLRETRLDELPQIWNVLWGDMSFIGPRPVRPSVYEERCRKIPNYDRRFHVRPGLIGYSQLLTPHSAPKRLRSRIDNHLINHPLAKWQQLRLMMLTGFAVARKVVARCRRFAHVSLLRRGHGGERRRLDRQPGRHADVWLRDSAHPSPRVVSVVVDVNEHALRLRTCEPIRIACASEFEMRIRERSGSARERHKTARCRIESVRTRTAGAEFECVVWYKPASEMGRYIIDQYLLHKSLLPTRRR